MRKWRAIIWCALPALVLGGLAFALLRPAEPLYKGKPVSYWAAGFQNPGAALKHSNPGQPGPSDEIEAMQHLGTNAIPPLLRMLRAHDGPLKAALLKLAYKQNLIKIHRMPSETVNWEAQNALVLLGPDGKIAIPELIKIYDENVSPASQRCVAWIFYTLGTNAQPAVPSLLREAVSNKNDESRYAAIEALGAIHGDAAVVVPVLIKALRDPVANNRQQAAYALASYKSEAKSAVGPLIQMRENGEGVRYGRADTFAAVRAAADFALLHIDTNAAAKVGAK